MKKMDLQLKLNKKMIYLIITKDKEAFFTDWFDLDNFYNPEVMYCVINMIEGEITFDGQTWELIEEDHL